MIEKSTVEHASSRSFQSQKKEYEEVHVPALKPAARDAGKLKLSLRLSVCLSRINMSRSDSLRSTGMQRFEELESNSSTHDQSNIRRR